jgi:hypothetical protein
VARLKGGNVCIDEYEGLNETNLFDDRVIGLAVKFCAFGKSRIYSVRVWSKIILLMKSPSSF